MTNKIRLNIRFVKYLCDQIDHRNSATFSSQMKVILFGRSYDHLDSGIFILTFTAKFI